MADAPEKAFILAAGKGTRLRPYTDTVPKPMVDIAGKSIIRRAIEKLKMQGVREIVINLHHLGHVLESHLQGIKDPRIVFSREEELLETGGGLKKGLHHFDGKPFYIINGDALWDDAQDTALSRLAKAWNEETMDILLLLQPVSHMNLTAGVGDYSLQEDGRATRVKSKDGQYMFAGIRIAHPRIFDNAPDGPFSFLSLMDEAERNGRLHAIAHLADWYHISTPEDLESVNAAFRAEGK